MEQAIGMETENAGCGDRDGSPSRGEARSRVFALHQVAWCLLMRSAVQNLDYDLPALVRASGSLRRSLAAFSPLDCGVAAAWAWGARRDAGITVDGEVAQFSRAAVAQPRAVGPKPGESEP